MSKAISLFSGYSQKENRTTNYCLLILKLLYEENPKYLGEVLSAIMGEGVGDSIGVQFRQQERHSESVPDGLIRQKPFALYIEAKNTNWFYLDQIDRHLGALSQEAPGHGILLALSNFGSSGEMRFDDVHQMCREKYGGQVKFAAANFADLLDALRALNLPKNLADTVEDFGAYLDAENLLPNWQTTLDVVNCATQINEPMDQVYLCGVTGGAYNHKRCKFFGLYQRKRVSHVCLIRAVVDVESPTEQRVLWVNDGSPEQELKTLAQSKLHKWRQTAYPSRVFLLGEFEETDFVKDTPGGMMGSKQYFSIQSQTAVELAEELRGRTWSTQPRG